MSSSNTKIFLFFWTLCIPKYPCLFGNPLKYPCSFGHTVSRNIHFYLDTLYPEISMLIWTPFISNFHIYLDTLTLYPEISIFIWTSCISNNHVQNIQKYPCLSKYFFLLKHQIIHIYLDTTGIIKIINARLKS